MQNEVDEVENEVVLSEECTKGLSDFEDWAYEDWRERKFFGGEQNET